MPNQGSSPLSSSSALGDDDSGVGSSGLPVYDRISSRPVASSASAGDEDFLQIRQQPSPRWATFDKLPFYVAPETRELLENCAALHLRRPDLVPYAEGLSWASPRVLLRGQSGTERYAEMLVQSLAKAMRCPLVTFDARRASAPSRRSSTPAAGTPPPRGGPARLRRRPAARLAGIVRRTPPVLAPTAASSWLAVTPAEVEAARLLQDRTDLSNAEKVSAILSARHTGLASISPPPAPSASPPPAPAGAQGAAGAEEAVEGAVRGFSAIKREIEATMAALRSASAEAEEEERGSPRPSVGPAAFRRGDRVQFVGVFEAGSDGPAPRPGDLGTVVSVPEAREGFRDEVRVRFDSDGAGGEDGPACPVRAADLRPAGSSPSVVASRGQQPPPPQPKLTSLIPSTASIMSSTSMLLSDAPGAPPARPLFAPRSPSPGPAALDLRDCFDRALEAAQRLSSQEGACILYLPEVERSALASSQRAAEHVAAALARVPSGTPLLVVASNTSLSASGLGALLGSPDSDPEEADWLGGPSASSAGPSALLIRAGSPPPGGRPMSLASALSTSPRTSASALARRVESILRGVTSGLPKSRLDSLSRPLGSSSPAAEDLSRAFPSLVYITPPLHDSLLMDRWNRAVEAERGRATAAANQELLARVLGRTGARLDLRPPRRPAPSSAAPAPSTSSSSSPPRPLLVLFLPAGLAAAERVAAYALAHHAATAPPPRRRAGAGAPAGPAPPRIRAASLRWALRMAGLASEGPGSPPAALEPPLSRAAAVLREGPKNEHEAALMSEVIPPHEINVRFEDIGALDGVKESLKELVMLPLRRPELFRRGNLTRPTKGVLLFGPPGTGKTMLAKAVATEAGAAFLAVSHSSINSKFFGESEKLVRALFSLASRMAPTVIFIDEVDSMMGRRGERDFESSRSVKNELMSLWDGLRSRESERILVLAATNRPFDLDEAVLRRFSRRFFVDLPDAENRAKILRVILAAEELAADVSFDEIARMTKGYSGSDLKNLCISAAYQPIRDYLRAEAAEAEAAAAAGGAAQASKALDGFRSARSDPFGSRRLRGRSERPTPPLRPICLDDFRKGLMEVSASVSNDGGTLDQLRTWNETYGDGGSRSKSSRRLGFHFEFEAEPEAHAPPTSTEP
eukprot:tig00021179_g19247.t1